MLIVSNADWQTGQASSVRAGLRALSANTGAAVFLLSDQPQITFDVIAALIDTHAAELHPIVAPLVMMEQRANPVLFDRVDVPRPAPVGGRCGRTGGLLQTSRGVHAMA